jgi:hypothetical protein
LARLPISLLGGVVLVLHHAAECQGTDCSDAQNECGDSGLSAPPHPPLAPGGRPREGASDEAAHGADCGLGPVYNSTAHSISPRLLEGNLKVQAGTPVVSPPYIDPACRNSIGRSSQ